MREIGRRRVYRRLAATGALALLVVAAWGTPAFAHAVLEGTDPGAGATVTTSPKGVTLTFTEPVEIALGGIRAYDSRARRLDVGDPTHPDGRTTVGATMPDLDDGTYVITWRVLSADAHPIRGAFTFTVGSSSTTAKEAQGLAQRLLTDEGGSAAVGVLYAIVRFGAFAGLAVSIGGALFLATVWRGGRNDRRARTVVWSAWGAAIGCTVLVFALQGPYAGALPLTKVVDPSILSEVATTRLGHFSLARIGLLLVAIPFLRLLLPRRGPAIEQPLPGWWAAGGAVLALALCSTPGLAGHASSGPLIPLAVASDTLHVAGVAAWLGGLIVLFAALMPRADESTLRAAVPRYSQFALVAVSVIVVTGIFQSFRQINRVGALLDTDFGRLLLIKVVVFLVLMVVAAVSRDVVNRRWRIPVDALAAPVAVGAAVGGGAAAARGPAGADPGPPDEPEFPEGYVLEEATAEKRLRRLLLIEVLISVVILAVTALLVNAAPAREADTGPFLATLRTDELSFDVTVTPANRGDNEMHLFTLGPDGLTTDPTDVTAELSQPANDIAPIEMELIRLAPGHYTTSAFTVPFAGDWELTIRAVVNDVDAVTASTIVPIHS